ncbi:molluscan insulin-related peptide 3-like [Physella acuta]|uniref:molluscan insulin-related peptide 3-like n=1 Tax=Physella acuta TaxID=109671 RepID=UPI0027DBE1FD|nr:molluscan insulin-related peptide 3-like [Physella acuta]
MSVPSPVVLASVLIFLLAFNVCGVLAQDRPCSYHDRPHPRGLCGSNLANTVQLLCESRGLRSKRDAEKDGDDKFDVMTLTKKSALTYLGKREYTANIVCECCYNRCSQSEMLAYC